MKMKKIEKLFLAILLCLSMFSANSQTIELTVSDTLTCEVLRYTYLARANLNRLNLGSDKRMGRNYEFEKYLKQNRFQFKFLTKENSDNYLLLNEGGLYEVNFTNLEDFNDFKIKTELKYERRLLVVLEEVEIKYGELEKIRHTRKLLKKGRTEAAILAKAMGKRIDKELKVTYSYDAQNKNRYPENIIRVKDANQKVQLPNAEKIFIKSMTLKIEYSLE